MKIIYNSCYNQLSNFKKKILCLKPHKRNTLRIIIISVIKKYMHTNIKNLSLLLNEIQKIQTY